MLDFLRKVKARILDELDFMNVFVMWKLSSETCDDRGLIEVIGN